MARHGGPVDKDSAWRTISRERATLGALLQTLTAEQWEAPTLCAGWSVRDVAAHVISWPDITWRQTIAGAWRSRGDYDRMIRDEAKRRARRDTTHIVDDFRRLSESRHRPPLVTYHEAMLDVLVHTQDITIPLGIRHEMPLEEARDCAVRTWRMSFPFRARKQLAGYRLVATDVDWAAGDGALVEGPIAPLLLLLTGRHAGLGSLRGEGAAALRAAVPSPAGLGRA